MLLYIDFFTSNAYHGSQDLSRDTKANCKISVIIPPLNIDVIHDNSGNIRRGTCCYLLIFLIKAIHTTSAKAAVSGVLMQSLITATK